MTSSPNDDKLPRLVGVLDTSAGSDRRIRRVAPDEPILSAFDLAATRGDGAFESMLVVAGVPNKPERHLARFARSTAALGIRGPGDDDWAALIAELVADWPSDAEGVLKLVVSRGQEGEPDGQPATAYGTLVPISPTLVAQRRDGVAVVNLSLGYPAAARQQSPWLLGGVKYLSYAVNMAAKRHAASVGADDVIFTSAEGTVLEGPSSTVISEHDDTIRTPPTDTGILRGTTQELLFDRLGDIGMKGAIRPATIDDLLGAAGAWLCSSTRGIAAIRSIDGKAMPQSDLTARLQQLIGIPVGGSGCRTAG